MNERVPDGIAEDARPAPVWQFSIAQILSLTAFVACAMVVVRILPWQDWVRPLSLMPWQGWTIAILWLLQVLALAWLWNTGDRYVRAWITVGIMPFALLMAAHMITQPSERWPGPLLVLVWFGVSGAAGLGALTALEGEHRPPAVLSLMLVIAANITLLVLMLPAVQ
jgi:hypothetical protein